MLKILAAAAIVVVAFLAYVFLLHDGGASTELARLTIGGSSA